MSSDRIPVFSAYKSLSTFSYKFYCFLSPSSLSTKMSADMSASPPIHTGYMTHYPMLDDIGNEVCLITFIRFQCCPKCFLIWPDAEETEGFGHIIINPDPAISNAESGIKYAMM